MAETAFLEGRKHAPVCLGRVLVLGLGKSGRACADYLAKLLGTRVESLFVAGGKSSESAEAWAVSARERGAQVVFDCESFDERFDLCIASPGISQFSDFYRNAQQASCEIISEVEFAWRESASDSRWVAVTGTNGKTTTTAMAEHLLLTAGLKAAAVGNIGDTCIEAVAAGKTEVYVAEVSSYQLASTALFAPEAAVVLNITPDHLSWHRSHEAYAAAKWRVLANLAFVPGAVAVLCATDDEVRAKIREIKALDAQERGFSYVPVGTKDGVSFDMRRACGSENAAFLDDGVLAVAMGGCEHALVSADALQVKGGHNVENALAAAAAALALGVSDEAVRRGLASFAPLEHRIEPCGEVAGVACYNDSKATNVDAVLKALVAFGEVKPVILLGGRDKGTELEPLLEACNASAKAVVLFGESRPRFEKAFAHAACPVVLAEGLESALDAALGCAHPGDVVLLSPACASFDEFSCFEERGEVFKALVAKRAAAAAAASEADEAASISSASDEAGLR